MPMEQFCLKKYTYDALIGGHNNIRISKITENDDDYVTFLTGKKSDKKENDIELFVILKMRTVGNKVLASTTLKNKSHYDRYIFITNIPYNHGVKHHDYFYSLCEDMFSIFTDDYIKLEFLGEGCLPENMEIDSWVKIAPQQEMTFTVILNGSYLFLAGEHNYQIKTADYLVVDEKWFITEKINKNLFSIVDFNYPKCKLKKYHYFFQKEAELCEADPWAEDSIEYFMTLYFPYGDKSPSFHKINSNQVSIKIDGNKIKSFYDIPRGLRS